MGLDTTIEVKVRNKNTNEYVILTLCYFRKCYTIARRLEELFEEAGIPIRAYSNTYKTLVKDFDFIEVYKILSEEYDDTINYPYDVDAVWDTGTYMRVLSNNILAVSTFSMFIKGLINLEELKSGVTGIGLYEDLGEIDDTCDWDWETAELELCNSY